MRYGDNSSTVEIFYKGLNIINDKQYHELRICNYGIGIEPNYAEKLFELYYRTETAKYKNPTGTGIGLYVARKIMNAHYGMHASATMKKYKTCIDEKLKKNSDSIVALFRLLKALLKLSPYRCEKCESCDYKIEGIKKDVNWIFYFITLPNLRGPPQIKADKIQI